MFAELKNYVKLIPKIKIKKSKQIKLKIKNENKSKKNIIQGCKN